MLLLSTFSLPCFRQLANFKLQPPDRSQLISWTKGAWNALSATTICSGFTKANIIPQPDGLGPEADGSSSELSWESLVELMSEVN